MGLRADHPTSEARKRRYREGDSSAQTWQRLVKPGLRAANVPPNLPSHRSLRWGHCGRQERAYLEAEASSGVSPPSGASLRSPGPLLHQWRSQTSANPAPQTRVREPGVGTAQHAGVWVTQASCTEICSRTWLHFRSRGFAPPPCG